MADTSMDYSEYSENENSPMPVAKVRESIRIERWTPPPKSWWVVRFRRRVCLTTKLMRY